MVSLAHLTICFRISGPAIDQSSLLPSLDPAPRAPEVNMMPGTRRLDTDVTEYEYVDTYPRCVNHKFVSDRSSRTVNNISF